MQTMAMVRFDLTYWYIEIDKTEYSPMSFDEARSFQHEDEVN